MKLTKILFIVLLIAFAKNAWSQTAVDTPVIATAPNVFIDYNNPRTYILANIVITGTNFYDKSVLMVLSGLTVGQKIRIPSEEITKSITNLYKQKLFDDVSMRILDIEDDKLTLKYF